MEHDIIIGGSMALASVIASLAIVFRIARAVRETPRMRETPQVAAATPSGTVPALRPVQGW